MICSFIHFLIHSPFIDSFVHSLNKCLLNFSNIFSTAVGSENKGMRKADKPSLFIKTIFLTTGPPGSKFNKTMGIIKLQEEFQKIPLKEIWPHETCIL